MTYFKTNKLGANCGIGVAKVGVVGEIRAGIIYKVRVWNKVVIEAKWNINFEEYGELNSQMALIF